jgi:hypothetical protein
MSRIATFMLIHHRLKHVERIKLGFLTQVVSLTEFKR